jgi:hypothetical protein
VLTQEADAERGKTGRILTTAPAGAGTVGCIPQLPATGTHTHLEGAVPGVIGNGLGPLLSGHKEQGGEALDLEVRVLILSAVHLGNHHTVHLGKPLGKLLPNGLKLLAVAAPGGIHLQ